ncbi:MAG TPA: phosphoribosylglycinamide formyltransferase [Fimbriimonadaceae bacterium]|nr:phosphoribosylglycinamide formyltransferase [Fimbriimonadaceae bacterium]HRJ95741.1 phosphoribosylglycinamide formyltransferase [Fimbriimonadaceae bacterium]
MHSPARLAIFVGPRSKGSNMKAIAEACARGSIPAVVARVVAPAESAPALATASALGLPVTVLDPSAQDYADRVLEMADRDQWDLICLAGFLRLVPAAVLERFPRRVLNIHPALLPRFGGKGMFGRHVHDAVLKSGDLESGCTVHLVDERYDEGEIVLQLRCPVLPGDTVDTLAARVAELEHEAYPKAIGMVIERGC